MDEDARRPLELIPDGVDLEDQTVQGIYLERFVKALWPEVRTLPLKQRWAFLLHLDREEIVAFIHHGCCSLHQVAESLQISPEEFAEWFARIPAPDDSIAERLGLARRQVINLRKCARERLGRRLKAWD